MILVTSLSPNHINKSIQQRAIDSWNKLGFDCYSFNHESEVESVSQYKGIQIINAKLTGKHIFGKYYVMISDVIDWCKQTPENHFCITNSDIEFDYNPKLIQKIKNELTDKMIISHREDYDKSKKDSKTYFLGIDAFFLNKQHLQVFPPSSLCIGQCFWDYHMPFTAIENGIKVINLKNKLIYHKKHPVQYSPENWETTGKIFAIEHNLKINNIGRLNELMFNFLNINIPKTTL